jgi:GH35 family endo-1,4-beta-xylanase
MKVRNVAVAIGIAVTFAGLAVQFRPASADTSGLKVEKFDTGNVVERWSGSIQAPETGLFTFIITGSTSELTIDGVKVVDEWQDPRFDRIGKLQLVADRRYDFDLSVFRSPTATSPGLEWSGPSFGRRIIPWDGQTLAPSRVPIVGLPINAPLRDLARARGIKIGVAVDSRGLFDATDATYRDLAHREFSIVSQEGGGFLDTYGTNIDEELRYEQPLSEIPAPMVNDAVANNQEIHGAHLLWFEQGTFTYQKWLQELSKDTAKRDTFAKKHVEQLMYRYGYQRQVQSWNVINEAVDDKGNFRTDFLDSYYDNQRNWLAGKEVVINAFRWARAADPGALLFYNDYAIENDGKKWDAVLKLVKELKDENLIDGVGFQAHLSIGAPIDQGQFDNHLRQLDSLGLKVRITELDVPVSDAVPSPSESEKQRRQATIFSQMVGSCLHANNCDAVIIWGLTDAFSWKRNPRGNDPTYGPDSRATIFTSKYEKKDAYWGINYKLRGQG